MATNTTKLKAVVCGTFESLTVATTMVDTDACSALVLELTVFFLQLILYHDAGTNYLVVL